MLSNNGHKKKKKKILTKYFNVSDVTYIIGI